MPGQTGSTINRHIADGGVGARKKSTSRRDLVYQYESCQQNVPILNALNSGFPTGATGTTGRVMFPGGGVLMTYAGAGQTLLGPTLDVAQGALDVALDGVDNEGVDYVFSDGYGAGARHTNVIGTSAAMFFKISVTIEDVSGVDQVLCGWRKAEASQADFNDFDEMAAFNIISGDVFVDTILNGGATGSVDSGLNWADGETKVFTTIVNEVGPPTGTQRFLLDGDNVGVNPFVWDAAEVIVPFFYPLQDADISRVWWNWFEIGEIRNVERAV